ncbi:MAG: hypothetical protein A2X19_00465 [Bacteroidetes bacterium GWE2_39_28]|nr:MAG: hypothetical protein A2X19_00465 [Bacteroidetes bacterium GWE2_39_28]OFY14542.1 MAG: hypothetical protein A2X16_09525 [Bacteroidetes bacterium GWF2_39_10]OFZ08895.1 MAG: hypothetical protein A2322_00695 [Bacteroidetes bacterium RIFOXYB2_FULL_39_7]OFZ10431.1 MAG: hypothetical protein A2465_07265 [Bacteroidetes bacterium RIFOXYC2_FULL_39_11]HCT93304.1 site-specific integrase [Rikenellaceae bacterium]
MNYSCKVIIRPEKKSKITNEVPVCLRIIKDRQITYKTIFKINPTFWDVEKCSIKKSHPNSNELNASISKEKAELEKEILLLNLSQETQGVSAIRNKIQKRTSLDFFQYADKYIEEVETRGNYSTYKKNKTVIWKLKNYLEKKTLPISNINIDFINKYEQYLSDTLGNNRNTITVNLKAIAKLLKEIYRQYELDENSNPFRKYKFKREKSNRPYLTEEELNKILNLKIRIRNPLYDAKDVFLIESYTGLRISDILCLKWKDYSGDFINIRMRKTEELISIPLSDVAKKIISKKENILENHNIQKNPDKYIFNILKIDVEKADKRDSLNAISCSTAFINKNLKKIAVLAGITKKLSTHVGRHTFATLLITKDANMSAIQALLGHSDIRTTQIYAKLIDTKKVEAINKLNNRI